MINQNLGGIMVKKHTEGNAIDVIIDALSKLEDNNARMRVINLICQKYEIQPTFQGVRKLTDDMEAGQQPNPPLSDSKNFMNIKKPKNNYQRLACLAYFLQENKGINEFNSKILGEANTEARQTVIPDISVYLTDATAKYRFFTPTKKGKKLLTAIGEAVVKALPDQDKVKQLLKEDYKYRTKIKRKRKGKTK